MEKIYFGAGCFWGVQAQFKELEGVVKTTVGYGGGQTENPNYKEVCEGETGHIELVEVDFDPSKLELSQLFEMFFKLHNPTTPNRQGFDVGTQYRSAIMTTTNEQLEKAKSYIVDLEKQSIFNSPIVTEVLEMSKYYLAEDYHQDYLDKNPGMCHI